MQKIEYLEKVYLLGRALKDSSLAETRRANSLVGKLSTLARFYPAFKTSQGNVPEPCTIANFIDLVGQRTNFQLTPDENTALEGMLFMLDA